MRQIYQPRLYPERVATIYDLIDSEPCTFNEVVRKTDLHPRTVSRILRRLEERGQAMMTTVNERIVERYTGVLRYFRYNLWFTPRLKEEEPELIRRKRMVIREISEVGLRSAMRCERVLQLAVWRVWGYRPYQIIIAEFDSEEPDVKIIPEKLTIEISTRFDNPVDKEYLKAKWIQRPDNYRTILFATRFAPDTENYARKFKFTLERLPFAEFPIFHADREYVKYFDEVKRGYSMVRYWTLVELLAARLRPYRTIL